MKVDEAFALVEKETEVSDELSYMEATSVIIRAAWGFVFKEKYGKDNPDREAAQEILQQLRKEGKGPYSRVDIWGGIILSFAAKSDSAEFEVLCRRTAIKFLQPGALDRFIEDVMKETVRRAAKHDAVPEDIDLGDFE